MTSLSVTKLNCLLTASAVAMLGTAMLSTVGAAPALAKACPYKWEYQYRYNAYTRRMENRRVRVIDHSACIQQRQAESRQRQSRQTSSGSNQSGSSQSAAMTVRVATRGDRLRLRSGPGTGYAVVGSAANGAALQLTGRYQGDWVELSDGSWAHSDYLKR